MNESQLPLSILYYRLIIYQFQDISEITRKNVLLFYEYHDFLDASFAGYLGDI